ncbi:nucleotidyltransferase substrate binding protein [Algoriphagus boritolerans]|uniref:Nucleotidyltransferase substrate binding protein, HI0074 family n=1 Tax=Algoriphagus boritolerans DSM 17298 = JCM 18970 TaxID=1120964 RepID=A0A1H5S2U0_9BACT|nr:nucleotidyltransferase substrate binding protein [Algoriphagus boritolerans]SEF44915.1 nucleotidyltransferase substrate binding protein, HI0074 family [Algoriphagus boritolerans DSM 17298 = JCM 18970]
MDKDIRWIQRLDNFQKAINLLVEVEFMDLAELSQLEKEGIVQRFEYNLELGWKTLKDKMEFDGLILDRISPKVGVKEAFQAKYIDQIEVWLEMINDRNLLSHSYDLETFESVIPDIQSVYTPLLASLAKKLSEIH